MKRFDCNPTVFHLELQSLDPDSLSGEKIEFLGQLLNGKVFLGADEIYK